MAFALKGKVSLITGGATGIGFCCVKELLRNGVQGATIADIDEKKGQEAVNEITAEFGSDRALFVKTDVTKADQLEAAFKQTINKWKTVDVVINNAGIMKESQWPLEISVNCGAMVHGSFLALEYMGKDKGGKGGVVVNMASVASFTISEVVPVYCATKHFVVAFSRSLGLPYHYDRTGVKILALCPGATDTNIIPESIHYPLNNSTDIAERQDFQFRHITWQEPTYVAQAVVNIITKGESGSVWIVEESKPTYQVHIPDKEALQRS